MDNLKGELEAERERKITRERWRLLIQLEHALELPMICLGFVWLALLVVELATGLSAVMQWAVTVIRILFIVDFLIKLAIAPRKRTFLLRNWLTMIALVIPVLRVARIGFVRGSSESDGRRGVFASCGFSVRRTAGCARCGKRCDGGVSDTSFWRPLWLR